MQLARSPIGCSSRVFAVSAKRFSAGPWPIKNCQPDAFLQKSLKFAAELNIRQIWSDTEGIEAKLTKILKHLCKIHLYVGVFIASALCFSRLQVRFKRSTCMRLRRAAATLRPNG